MTLTTQDKKDIREIVDGALVKFAEELIKPSFETVYEKLGEHDKDLNEVKEELRKMDRKLDLVAEKVTTHEKRISHLEVQPTPGVE